MSKHTPEPWFLSKVDNGISYEGGLAIDAIDTSDGELLEICEVWGVDDNREHDERSMANARRIVACVNACEGMAADELDTLPRGFKRLQAAYLDLYNERTKPAETLRDELLAALEWSDPQIMEFISIAFRHAEIKGDFELSDVRDALSMVNSNAIAKAKGL